MKISKCKHCGLEKDISNLSKGWMANHSRWCEKNPKRNEYVNGSNHAIHAMNLARKQTGRTNQYEAAKLDNIPAPISPMKGKTGRFLGKRHSFETKKLLSEKARNSKHRRLRRNMVEYNGVMMDSTWEVRLAKKLDSDHIQWIRPDPIKYTDLHGKNRHYFPDFYLPKYNLYLDPKNPAAYIAQKEKISVLTKTYDNIIILRTLDEIDNFTPVAQLEARKISTL